MTDKIAKKGDSVKVDYEGRFESGEVFDTSSHGDHSHPLEFEVGAGEVIKGFDEAVIGMKVGEEKEVKITAKEAYGEVKKELFKEFPKKNLSTDKEPKEGMTLVLSTPNGQKLQAKIMKVGEDHVTLDFNHPLAGKNLIFKIKLIEVN